MPRSEQIPRQWRILKRLEAHRYGLAASDLAEEEDCPVRTIYRDLDDLEEAGFPLVQEKRGKRSLWRLAFLRDGPQVPFTFTELYSLLLGRGFMEMMKGTDFYESICSAFEKIRSTLVPGTLEHLEEFEQKWAIGQPIAQDFAKHSEMIGVINEALAECERLKIRYFTPDAETVRSREVDPYRLWISSGAMYLIGYCHLRQEVRTFNIARIRELHPTGEYFEEDPSFDLEEHLAGGFRTMTGKVMTVEIRFDHRVRHVAEEKIWHPTQQLIEGEDGSVLLRLKAGGLKEIKTWVLSFGPKVEVLQPPELREAVQHDLEAALQRYRSSDV